MRVLITGVGGFIGRSLAQRFLADGWDVLGLYRTTRPCLTEGPGRLRLVQVDLAEGMERVEGADLVIHAAAHTHLIKGSVAADYVRNNLVAGLNLNEYLRRTLPGRVVYLSTLSVYGEIDHSPLTEASPLNQPGFYGLSKYMGEEILREISAEVPVSCFRLPGVVGAGYFEPWLGKVLTKALRDEEIGIYNPEGLFNNIVDPTEIYRLILHLPGCGAPAFDRLNLAASEPLSVREVVASLLRVSGSASAVREMTHEKTPFLISIDKLVSDYGFIPRSTRSLVEDYAAVNAKISRTTPCHTEGVN